MHFSSDWNTASAYERVAQMHHQILLIRRVHDDADKRRQGIMVVKATNNTSSAVHTERAKEAGALRRKDRASPKNEPKPNEPSWIQRLRLATYKKSKKQSRRKHRTRKQNDKRHRPNGASSKRSS
jgi:hypothetical protein